ncbi:MAG: glycosyltransferase [Gallionella sp.]|nr:glycosyltransferase [Gallionella sp.]
MTHKPVILVVTGYYSPGFKAGGVLRNIINTVDNLCDQFEFRIITRDRDLGDEMAFPDIQPEVWLPVGNATVYYLSPEVEHFGRLGRLLADTPHDLLFLSSYFDPLTIRTLLNRRLRGLRHPRAIVAPFGEFAGASLTQKYAKKLAYILFAKIVGLYRDVTWRVSSSYEAEDLIRVLGVGPDSIAVTGDLPTRSFLPEHENQSTSGSRPEGDGLRVIFLSRIAREKNLDYALKVLKKVSAKIYFDIYGPAENVAYWDECKRIIAGMPANIVVSYKGKVSPDEVVRIFAQYDLFLFPTGGEAYGNVIAESLIAGTPVLISTETPWRSLRSDGLGWDLDLDEPDRFVRVIDELSGLSHQRRMEDRVTVMRNIKTRLFDAEVLASNKRLFESHLNQIDP